MRSEWGNRPKPAWITFFDFFFVTFFAIYGLTFAVLGLLLWLDVIP
jgi:hypothetical protein